VGPQGLQVGDRKARKTETRRIFYGVVWGSEWAGTSLNGFKLPRGLGCCPERLSCDSDVMRALMDEPLPGAEVSAVFKVFRGALFSGDLAPRKVADQAQLSACAHGPQDRESCCPMPRSGSEVA
jgi:hypothetical protein